MFVIDPKKNGLRVPVKVWLEKSEDIEDNCLEQVNNLARLPFLHRWVALMPDTHAGKGMPIGGVIATTDVIIPNAVGVDIGCGMIFVPTNVLLSDIDVIETPNGSLIKMIVNDILRNIPVGFNRYKSRQPSKVLDRACNEAERYEVNSELMPLIEDGYYQVGTLGGGNHFIEIQADDEGYVGIMIHSGSRHLGKEICDYFNNRARALNKKWYSQVPLEYRLAFLPTDTNEGMQYINWMNLSLDYAYENRYIMILRAMEIVSHHIDKYAGIKVEYGEIINCHHNYASLENHYNKNVWVHRKGATRARKGEIAVIPGAMGSYSYVVEGLGNEESFCSSSHGAGRRYSRKGAKENFSVEEVMIDLKDKGVVIGKHNKQDVAEECRFAYKDIDEVMANQTDIVRPIKRLKTVGVVKG